MIKLEPAQAGQTLMQVQGTMRSYLQEIGELENVLRDVATTTFSTPLSEVFSALAQTLTQVGESVNDAIDAYGQGFVEIIDRWRQSDATAASAISFTKSPFAGVHIAVNEASKVEVEPAKVRNLLEQQQSHSQRLGSHFTNMTEEIQHSTGYFIGESGDSVRRFWNSSVLPLNEQSTRLLQQVADHISQALDEFIRRDQTNVMA